MSTDQLKNLVIDKISEIEDEGFLIAINKILDTNLLSASPRKLTLEQRKKVLIGLEQLGKGEIISNEDLEKAEDEWLKE
jgi:hypothetical protein